MIESAMIGRVGGSAAFDNQVSLNRVIVQVTGAASALNVDRFRELAQRSESFRAKLARHEHFVLAQAQQSAACNATHTLEERLCRWLLRCRDLLDSDDIPLTGEFLAEMLGVRRTSVTLVATASSALRPRSTFCVPLRGGDVHDAGREPARIFSIGHGLIARRGTARQQFSIFAEYKHRDRLLLSTVTAEFRGDDRGVGFSLTQRRKLFTDVIGQRSATVLCLEEVAGHCKTLLRS
jgi:Crp-like helix-turn-helix protein